MINNHPTKFFICKTENSLTLDRGQVYVYVPSYGFDIHDAVHVISYDIYAKEGAKPLVGVTASKDDLIEISEEEFEEFSNLWLEWNKNECDAQFVHDYVESLISKYEKEIV